MAKLLALKISTVYDESPDLSYLTQDYADVKSPVTRNLYRKQDRERLAAYNRGDWNMMGVRVVADVELAGVTQRFCSPGLWGVESDSGEAYVREIAVDELITLRDILADAAGAAGALRHIGTLDVAGLEID